MRDARPVRARDIFRAWSPLAASWLLMGFELPLVSAVVARLPAPTVSLAAYGAVVFPLALIIESPIIMLLSASTALCRDWASYAFVRRFMWISGGLLTGLHVLVAFTPIYDFVIGGLLGAPEEIREPARVGLQILTPWTLSIAYRRFHQGVLIRFGHSNAIGIGTLVRLALNILVLAAGYLVGDVAGIVVGTAAVAAGVVGEAVYAGWRVQRVLREQVRPAPAHSPTLDWTRFARFYGPLAVTPIIMFFAMPMASAAMARMPLAIESLAVWPVLMGLVFLLRSVCFGLNEVAVALLDRPHAMPALSRFTGILAAATTAIMLTFALSPLGDIWFHRVAALRHDLARLGVIALWIAILLPGLTAYINLYQGVIVHSHRTRGVIESMVLFIGSMAILFGAGIAWQGAPGLHVAMLAMTVGNAVQGIWLAVRARAVVRELALRDAVVAPP